MAINNDVHIVVNEKNEMQVTIGGRPIEKQVNFGFYAKLIEEQKECYKRSNKMELLKEDTVTYNFYSQVDQESNVSMVNDIVINLSKKSNAFQSFDEELTNAVLFVQDPNNHKKVGKERLEEIKQKVVEYLEDHREKITKGAIITSVAAIGIASTIAFTSLCVNCLKQDIELSKNSPTGTISYSQGYEGPPDGYISNELQEERDQARREYKEKQRAYEEAMAAGALEPENANKIK